MNGVRSWPGERDVELKELVTRLRVPVICAPMFLVSDPSLTIAACRAGIVGSFNSHNARTSSELELWLNQIEAALEAARAQAPQVSVAPYALNLPARRQGNSRYDADLEICVRFQVPLVITMAGDPSEIVNAVHGYGGSVLHDVVSLDHARKAASAGVDGLIVLCAGAGGHTGNLNPFAFLPQVRKIFSGLLVLAGGISDGNGIRAAQVLGADLAYMGTRFIATRESNVPTRYKEMLLSQQTRDLVLTDAISGLSASFMRASIEAVGLDPDKLPPPKGLFQPELPDAIKAWRDVWSAGHGVGLIEDLPSMEDLVARLSAEYAAAAASR